jgi:hypothetical protein
MVRFSRVVLVAAVIVMLGAAPASASGSVSLDGSFSLKTVKKDFSLCSVADECGALQMVGLGTADYTYVYGPTFEPTGKKGCYYVDGTFTITLRSDGSSISGPLTGVYCRPGASAHQEGTPSYGNPSGEDDHVEFSGGTGQFAGLHGTAAFSEHFVGARSQGSLTGTLTS